MLNSQQVREANRLIDEIANLSKAIEMVEKRVWRDDPGETTTGYLGWNGTAIQGVDVPKEDMLAYLKSRKEKALAKLQALGVSYP